MYEISAKLMIPGTPSCPQLWTLEYSGFLMSSYYLNAINKEYVCVDEHPDVLLGSEHNTNGAGLFFAAASCSPSFLPCGGPYYIHNTPITCAVCTR